MSLLAHGRTVLERHSSRIEEPSNEKSDRSRNNVAPNACGRSLRTASSRTTMPGTEGKNPSAGEDDGQGAAGGRNSRCGQRNRATICSPSPSISIARRRYLSKIGRWDRRRIASRFRHGYKQAQARVICVEGKAIGWIQVAELVGRLHLRQLHLVRAHRGNGIGTRLIKDLLRRADALGKPVTLESSTATPRVRFISGSASARPARTPTRSKLSGARRRVNGAAKRRPAPDRRRRTAWRPKAVDRGPGARGHGTNYARVSFSARSDCWGSPRAACR